MTKIEPGKYVELGYDLYAVEADGSEKLVHQSDASDPEKIVFGVTRGVIEPLEKAIEGLAKGDSFNVEASADEAFGPYDPDQVVELDKEIFFVDDKFDSEVIREGAYVPMMTADGFRINGLVKEVTDTKVKMDFNHPLAGSACVSTDASPRCAMPPRPSCIRPRAAAAMATAKVTAAAATTAAATMTTKADAAAAAIDSRLSHTHPYIMSL